MGEVWVAVVSVRYVVSVMCNGYAWRLFHFEEKVKSVVKSVFAVRGYSRYDSIARVTEHRDRA